MQKYISYTKAVWITADKLKEGEMQAPSKQYFYNYTLGMPYQDTSTTFRADSVFDHVDNEFEKPETRTDYKFVACGIDFGEHYHHVVTLGMRSNGRIDLMDLYRVPRSVGAEHIEEDLKLLIRHMDMYQPDIILPDRGLN